MAGRADGLYTTRVHGVGRWPAFVGRFSDQAATGPHHPPCRATGQAGGPGTARCLGPGQHGARRPPGRAGPKQRATGRVGGLHGQI